MSIWSRFLHYYGIILGSKISTQYYWISRGFLGVIMGVPRRRPRSKRYILIWELFRIKGRPVCARAPPGLFLGPRNVSNWEASSAKISSKNIWKTYRNISRKVTTKRSQSRENTHPEFSQNHYNYHSENWRHFVEPCGGQGWVTAVLRLTEPMPTPDPLSTCTDRNASKPGGVGGFPIR